MSSFQDRARARVDRIRERTGGLTGAAGAGTATQGATRTG